MLSCARVGRCVREGNVYVDLMCIQYGNRSLKIEMYQRDSDSYHGLWVWRVACGAVYSVVGWRSGRVCAVVGPGMWFDGVQLVWSEPQ